MSKEAKQKIQQLIDKYEAAKAAGRIKFYTEEETKKDYILPLFEALGWDVYNRNEVTAEEKISGDRVDYGFYLNGRIKFYLEAKPFRADIHREEYAQQAIRYSWNKGVTWAVLTDFENLIVFNALSPEKSLHGKRYFEIPYTEYLSRFEQLWLLNKESFVKDLIDTEAQKVGKKIQKILVGDQLYKDLTECRRQLTKAFSVCNEEKNLDQHLIDEGVQRLLDRLIFIRVAEDRKIEPLILRPLVNEWKAGGHKGSPFSVMIKKFRELDKVYNSNLFAAHPFETWEEYDGATERVIDILYGKNGYIEYDFSIIPADVLGAVYENYLGYKLQQSETKRTLFGAELELSKDSRKRKEQGIYYTPGFIVDYIVKTALGQVLDRCKSVGDLQKVKVLDPACGSGSFLIRAMQLIVEKYQEFGLKNVTAFTKIQILTQNIYGVDLDEQAVEIARLNLLLNTFDAQIKLPNLSNNIKNGNSLISGTDEELKKYFGKNFRDKKPFNWQEEFPEVFKQGGFDVVIGNPPYIRVDALNIDDKEFWKDYFTTSEGKYDLYYLFIEKSIKLLHKNGKLGFIIPNKFCVADSGKKLRKFIFDSSSSQEFFSVSKVDVFKHASNYPIILFLEKGVSETKTVLSFAEQEMDILEKNINRLVIKKEDLDLLPNFIIPVNVDEKHLSLALRLLKNNKRFKDYLKISEGLRIPEKFETNTSKGFGIVKQYQFSRYSEIGEGSYVLEDDLKTVIKTTTERFKNSQKGKIIIAEDALFISATIDSSKMIPQGGVYFATQTLNNASLYALLGILNSKLLSFIYETMFGGMHMGGGYLRYRTAFIEQLPIEISGNNENIDKLVKQILKFNFELRSIPENSDKWRKLKTEIELIDKNIDEEVYKLYGLTDEEIQIVENDIK